MDDEFEIEFPEKGKAKKKEKPPQEVSPSLIRQQALRYLDRFSATTLKMRRHLMNKAAKSIEFHDLDPNTILEMIDIEIEKLVQSGIMNDQEYASSKARSMGRQGKSTLQINSKLQSLGFDDTQSDDALDSLREGGYTDRKAIARYIKKRRFGPYKPIEVREERFQKELSALVRNGFEFGLAKSILSLDTIEDIESILFDAD